MFNIIDMIKRIITNWRYYVLLVIAAVAVIGILSTPAEESENFFLTLVLSKVIGFAALFLACGLIDYWRRAGKIEEIKELED